MARFANILGINIPTSNTFYDTLYFDHLLIAIASVTQPPALLRPRRLSCGRYAGRQTLNDDDDPSQDVGESEDEDEAEEDFQDRILDLVNDIHIDGEQDEQGERADMIGISLLSSDSGDGSDNSIQFSGMRDKRS